MRILIHIALVCLPLLAFSQQVPQYSLYALNPYAYNPAYADAAQRIEAHALFRGQWVGMKGSPTSKLFHTTLPIPYLSSGVGLQVQNDALGALRFTQISLGYAYGMKVGRGYRLSLGLSAGIVQSALDGGKLRAPDGEYGLGTPIHNDGQLPTGTTSAMSHKLSAGLFLKGKNLQLGLSSQHLTQAGVNYDFDNAVNFVFSRHYMGFASYRIPLNHIFSLQPSILVKSDLTQTQAEASVLAEYQNQLRLGVSYRGFDANTSDAIVIMGGLRLSPRLTLMYSYDVTRSGLRDASQGSHEIMLGYELDRTIGKARLPKIIYNPRLL